MDLNTLFVEEEIFLKNNQPNLQTEIGLIDGDLAQIYTINHKNYNYCARLLMQQIEVQIAKEASYRAGQRFEEWEEKQGIRV